MKNVPGRTLLPRTNKYLSAVPPCLPKNGHSRLCQHTACPVTGATRQKILRRSPVPSALGGPFAAPLFTPFSATWGSLWMRLQRYFRLNGFCTIRCIKSQKYPFVKTFSHIMICSFFVRPPMLQSKCPYSFLLLVKGEICPGEDLLFRMTVV